MNIGFVLIPYQRFTGAGEHYHHLIMNILKIDTVNKYTIFLPFNSDASQFNSIPQATIVRAPIIEKPGPLRYAQTVFSRFIDRYRPRIDLLHCFNLPLPRLSHGKTVLTIHDLREEDFPKSYGWFHRTIMRVLTPAALKRVHHIFTVSQFSQDRLIAHYPFCAGKITIAYNAIDPSIVFRQIAGALSLQKRPYIFTIGQLSPHKNLANLIRAFNLLIQRGCDYNLVIAGHNFRSPEFTEKLFRLVTDPKRVIFTGRLSNQEKLLYLQNAKLFVYPSLYEGFGIPLLEAFALQVPVAASRIPVFDEVFGFSEAMFDPKDPMDIARVIEKVCDNNQLQKDIIEHGNRKLSEFTWEKTAKATVAVYNSFE